MRGVWRPLAVPGITNLRYDGDTDRWWANVLHVCGHGGQDYMVGHDFKTREHAEWSAMVEAAFPCRQCEAKCEWPGCDRLHVAVLMTDRGELRTCAPHARKPGEDIVPLAVDPIEPCPCDECTRRREHVERWRREDWRARLLFEEFNP